MKKLLPLVCLLLAGVRISAQTQLSGIINLYAKITAIDPCAAALTVQDATGFERGMKVWIIQMQGATINISNSNSYGAISNINSAGKFEKALIRSVNGNQIVLENTILNEYDINGAVQLVSFPSFSKATIDETLTAKAWDGNSGGVLALEVTDTLFINASIDVSGKGFRGGKASIAASNNCNALTTANAYFYGLDNWRGAAKGEGIAAISAGLESGRGPQANGGGGGNDHNAGGGGGAHITTGGGGGDNEEPNLLGCDGQFPGLGGRPLTQTADRIFMGGGGGAGHENNDVGTDGGNGGGIVLLFAKTVVGNDQQIHANGQTAATAAGDGAGGGGAGGTILLDIQSVAGGLLANARGGNGGSINNSGENRCHGPGGGGSGGRIFFKPNLQISFDLSRGEAGMGSNSASCGNGTNGAQAGNDGVLEEEWMIVESNIANNPISIVSEPDQHSACLGTAVTLAVVASGLDLQYQWQVDKSDGIGFQDLAESGIYSGTQTPSLFIGTVLAEAANYKYRLKIDNDCAAAVFTNALQIEVLPFPVAQFDFDINGTAVQFNNTSANAINYFWDFGDGQTSTDANASHRYADAGNFVVTLISTNSCGSDTSTQLLQIQGFPVANFGATPTGGCTPLSVVFSNLSANANSYAWILPGATPSFSISATPSVVYNTPGSYDVALVASNATGFDTLLLENFIVVQGSPTAAFEALAEDLNVRFLNNSTPDATYSWDFGDNTVSSAANPTHTYALPGSYTVSLTVSNACGNEMIRKMITVGVAPTALFTTNTRNGCAPLLATFTDASTGVYDSLLWTFPGGNPSSSTQPSQAVLYTTPGQYDVTLRVSGVLGSSTVEEENYVNVLIPPTAAFIYEIDGNKVQFFNNSSDATSIVWNFGDETSSTDANPVHEYSSSGVYTVTLNASNAYCGKAVSQTLSIGTSGVEDLQKADILVYPNPVQEVLFVETKNAGRPIACRFLNSSGQLMFETEFMQEASFDMTMFARGVYFLQLKEAQQSWVVKIVKN